MLIAEVGHEEDIHNTLRESMRRLLNEVNADDGDDAYVQVVDYIINMFSEFFDILVRKMFLCSFFLYIIV